VPGQTLYVLTPELASELMRIIRKVDGIKGDGVCNTPDAIAISAQSVRQATSEDSDELELPTPQYPGMVLMGGGNTLIYDFVEGTDEI
jgi:type IV secretory pathway protease TraF